MKQWLARMKKKPWIAHLLRAVSRFGNRLGGEFGAAITYFSILAVVPIVLFAFSILGFILTVLRPELIGEVATTVSRSLGATDASTRDKIVALVSDTLSNWKGVGIVGLISAIYSGAGWMGNLKNAVRAQWRPDFDLQEAEGNILKKTGVNLATLVGLLVLVALTFSLATLSTSVSTTILGWLGLSSVGWLHPLLRVVPIVFNVGAAWLLFMYLYSTLPESREPWPVVRRGALMGAIGLAALQYSTTFLFSIFGRNKAASLFGPAIVLMLFFNVFASLILFVAAWIATARQEAIFTGEEKVRFALTPESERRAEAESEALIPQHLAVQSMRLGLGAGYVTGAATGVGLGAGLAYVVSAAVRGRRRLRRRRD